MPQKSPMATFNDFRPPPLRAGTKAGALRAGDAHPLGHIEHGARRVMMYADIRSVRAGCRVMQVYRREPRNERSSSWLTSVSCLLLSASRNDVRVSPLLVREWVEVPVTVRHRPFVAHHPRPCLHALSSGPCSPAVHTCLVSRRCCVLACCARHRHLCSDVLGAQQCSGVGGHTTRNIYPICHPPPPFAASSFFFFSYV